MKKHLKDLGKPVARDSWIASNLFAPTAKMKPAKVWKSTIKLSEIAEGSYLSIAVNGEHGKEGAYVAAKIDGKFVGFPDRALAYPSNGWELYTSNRENNYTYYLPLSQQMVNKNIEIFVIGYNETKLNLYPEVYISANPIPYEKLELRLERK